MTPIHQRLKTFFEKLGNALRGLGYTTPEDIFFDIDEGKVTPTKKGEGESLTRMSFAADKPLAPQHQEGVKTCFARSVCHARRMQSLERASARFVVEQQTHHSQASLQ